MTPEEPEPFRLLAEYSAPPPRERFHKVDAGEMAQLVRRLTRPDATASTEFARQALSLDPAVAELAAELLGEGKPILVAQDEDGYYFATLDH